MTVKREAEVRRQGADDVRACAKLHLPKGRGTDNHDKFCSRHFLLWSCLLFIGIGLWEVGKAVTCNAVVSVLFLLPLSWYWLAGSIRNATQGRWRSAASIFLAPFLSGSLILALSLAGLDPDRIHFLLVKYSHENEIRTAGATGSLARSWSWGLDAAPLSAGVAYTLKYDPTDREMLSAHIPGKSVRPMGDHFYIVKESEDGGPL